MRKARCAFYGHTVHGKGKVDRWCDDKTIPTCMCEKESSRDLPFFIAMPDKEFDEFYCGCAIYGWD